jgi:hypothetical protein
LNNISDESQMSLDSRKYYVQSYDFTMLGYLIDEDEFEVKPAIQRSVQLFEFDATSSRGRKKTGEVDNSFEKNFLFINSNDVLSDRIDFTADMSLISSNNINTYDVYINGDYYGSDVQKIQITTNDILRIEVIKNTSGEDANILFDNRLV